ncbi:hypothetical protein B0H16DRAFT_1593363 [Mycena metata]|uniref:Uncharacterized protein n=1 Tax=Mycena metata TaxID=1033252 RepID=A0AAD7MPA7_9AGAR|nr:hypothetical protein B0H16DRAFT_1593363 [Mycena metata]
MKVLNILAAVFSKSPNLRQLQLLSKAVTPFVLPWDQLVTLRLDAATVGGCLKTLSRVPSLVDLTASLWAEELSAHDPVSLLHLQSLKLTLSHTRGPELLHFLQRLELNLYGQRQITHLTSLITPSSCFLRRLSVRLGPRWETVDFVRLFLALDSLEELDVRQATQSRDAVLAVLKGQPRMLLNLRSLSARCQTKKTSCYSRISSNPDATFPLVSPCRSSSNSSSWIPRLHPHPRMERIESPLID